MYLRSFYVSVKEYILSCVTVRQFLNEMEAEGIEPNVKTYGAMIDGCARASDVPKAFGLYRKMLNKVSFTTFTALLISKLLITDLAVKIFSIYTSNLRLSSLCLIL